jgi:hypothetical protein
VRLTRATGGAYDPMRMGSTAARPRTARQRSRVVDLAKARESRRLSEFRARCRTVDEVNRKAVAQLFQSGLIFTRRGARLGRDLLLAHQHLLRVSDLLDRMVDVPEGAEDAAALYGEAQALLARTSALAVRCGDVLARG